MGKSKTEELKEKKLQMQKRASDMDYKAISSKAIEEFEELQKLQPMKHQAFRLLPSDIETIRDIAHSLKMHLDPYMTQSKALHLMVRFFKEAIGEDLEERPAEVKLQVEKRSKAKKDSAKRKEQLKEGLGKSINKLNPAMEKYKESMTGDQDDDGL